MIEIFYSILGAFYTAVKQGFNQNLHAIFCLAENSVGERSTRPDDIHTLYSGKTVEINNTVLTHSEYSSFEFVAH
jgi:probable aminopeptidase NPEPL1